jgi:ABC-type glycerol-3-phosphate transport system permease component
MSWSPRLATLLVRVRRAQSGIGPYFGLGLFTLVFLVPVYWILLSSLLPRDKILATPPIYFSLDFTLKNFYNVFNQISAALLLRNSCIFAFSSAFLAVCFGLLAGYAFARYRWRGSNLLLLILLLSTALPQVATTIPLFQVYQRLGLINRLEGLILLEGSILIPFTVWIFIGYLRQIPTELEEAARMDGASLVQVLWYVVLPLTRPALATLFFVNFIVAWDELFYPLVFATSRSVQTLPVGLVQLTQQNVGVGTARPWDLMSSLSALMMVPVLIVVAMGQRWIIAGLTRGAVR